MAGEPHFVAPELVDVGPDGPGLVAGKCANCGALSFPKAVVCTECLSENIGAAELSKQGVLYSFSIVHQAPKGWSVPYALGYVDLPEGVRVLAHIVGAGGGVNGIGIDQQVRLGIAPVGTDADGSVLSSYVFTPVDGGGK